MKKIILSTIFILSMLVARDSFAQTGTTQCTGAAGITVFNYNFCCGTTAGAAANKAQCTAYNTRNGTTANPPVTGTVNSGVNTAPINTAAPTGSQANAPTPRSNSASLNQCSTKFTSLFDMLIWLKCIIVVAVIPLLFVLAFLFFLWGVMKFIQASDSTKKDEGKKFIMWGLIGLFVMTSVWGIIKILGNTLGVDSSTVPILQTTLKK